MKLYEFIERNRTPILNACLAQLQGLYKGKSAAELFIIVPSFLEELIGALRRDAGVAAIETADQSSGRENRETHSAKQHGETRELKGFGITRIVHDYGVVCDKVNDLAAKEKLGFDAREVRIMNICIDNAIASGVETFFAAASAGQQSLHAEEFGSFAHEIGNAAGAALLAFTMVYEGKVAPSGKTAHVVRRALSRIDLLVKNSLTQSRLRGNVPVFKQTLVLSDFCSQIADSLFPERGVRLESLVPADLSVDADEGLLHSAISNLVNNALKFTRENTVVSLRARAEGNQTVIEVEDRCGGLPPGKEEELFKPFVRETGTARGTGLGLSIVRKAMATLGGVVSVRNLPGVGCVFSLRLPGSSSEGKAAKAA